MEGEAIHHPWCIAVLVCIVLSQLLALNKCAVSYEGVHKSLLHIICSEIRGRYQLWGLHASVALILPWKKQNGRQKREKQMVWQCLSVLHWESDWHLLLRCRKKNQTKWRDVSRLECVIQLCLLSPSRPKDAMRALKKRLCGNKNYREVMLALTVRRAFTCDCAASNLYFVLMQEAVPMFLI